MSTKALVESDLIPLWRRKRPLVCWTHVTTRCCPVLFREVTAPKSSPKTLPLAAMHRSQWWNVSKWWAMKNHSYLPDSVLIKLLKVYQQHSASLKLWNARRTQALSMVSPRNSIKFHPCFKISTSLRSSGIARLWNRSRKQYAKPLSRGVEQDEASKASTILTKMQTSIAKRSSKRAWSDKEFQNFCSWQQKAQQYQSTTIQLTQLIQ